MSSDDSSYYDSKVRNKLRDFVEGNARVDVAWATLEAYAPTQPQRILEIGCGVGYVSWRMSLRWPHASTIGVDFSPASVTLAQRLFSGPRCSFYLGDVTETLSDIGEADFDLVVLMDVYEHVAPVDRGRLHAFLRNRLALNGRIFLSFPTPRHLAWLRTNHPDQIQPVDEDIDVGVIKALAVDTESTITLYTEVNVWRTADYAHAVLTRTAGLLPLLQDPVRPQLTVGWYISRLKWLKPVRLLRARRRLGQLS